MTVLQNAYSNGLRTPLSPPRKILEKYTGQEAAIAMKPQLTAPRTAGHFARARRKRKKKQVRRLCPRTGATGVRVTEQAIFFSSGYRAVCLRKHAVGSLRKVFESDDTVFFSQAFGQPLSRRRIRRLIGWTSNNMPSPRRHMRRTSRTRRDRFFVRRSDVVSAARRKKAVSYCSQAGTYRNMVDPGRSPYSRTNHDCCVAHASVVEREQDSPSRRVWALLRRLEWRPADPKSKTSTAAAHGLHHHNTHTHTRTETAVP